jgi:hypothetical protein
MDNTAPLGLFTLTTNGGGMVSSYSALYADKHSIAVTKARDVILINASYRTNKKPEVLDLLCQRLDLLLGYLLSQFKSQSDTEVRSIMSNASFNALDVEELSSLDDSLVPIAIIRVLLGKHRVTVNPKKLTNWAAFNERYQAQVMAA